MDDYQLTIPLPLSPRQALAVIIAAEAFSVEAWEIGCHALMWAQQFKITDTP